MKSLRLLALLALLPLMPSCGQIPIPPPDPDNPCWPLPPGSCQPPEPGTPYDCDNPPALAGVVSVDNAIQGKWIVVLKQQKTSFQAKGLLAQSVAARFSALKNVQLSSVGFSAEGDAKLLLDVSKDPAVAYVQQVGTKFVSAIPWGLDRIDQRDLPLDGQFAPKESGTGVHAFVIDTGIWPHDDFKDRLGECFSTITFGGCVDQHDHGTHVAGTVGGKEYGVAKAVTLHAVRFLDERGSGTDTDAIKAIDWVTQKCQENGWKCVSNSSWGGGKSPAVDQAMCNSIAAGVTHVVAAGNDSKAAACDASPADVKQAITMGATDNKDNAAYFTNVGECVDAFGPGVDVVSAGRGGGTKVFSGTSMASPHGTGVAALCVERGASTPAQVKQCVLENATKDHLKGIEDSPNLLLYVHKP